MRSVGRWLVVSIAAAFLWPLPAFASPVSDPVVVTVRETEGAERHDWPVTFGLPLPRGLIHDGARIRIGSRSGVDLPRQTRVLSRWSDGSLRWILIDARVSVPANGSEQLAAEVSSANPRPVPLAARLELSETPEHHAVDTGILRFRVPKKHFGPIEELSAGTARIRGPLRSVLGVNRQRLVAQPPARVELVEGGPLRARFELAGSYGDGFEYVLQLEAYAGQPFVRLRHTVLNRNPQPQATLEELSLEIPLEAGYDSYALGVEEAAVRRGEISAAGSRAVQLDNVEYQVNGAARQGRLAGWAERHGEKGRVGIAARWFWQEYPKSIVLQPKSLAYGMWAPEAPAGRFGSGAAKTHELLIWLVSSNATGADRVPFPVRPLVASVEPEWIARSKALAQAVSSGNATRPFLERARSAFDRYQRRNGKERWDDRGTAQCKGSGASRPRVGAYGMWNWGDWNFPGYQDSVKGCDAWGNLEYDTTQVLALLHAATGETEVYDAMTAAARHFMDVDVIHFQARHADWVGMNHPKNPLHFTFELGGIDLGHTWTEGLISYFYLTGEDRALEAARGIADYLVRRAGHVRRANPRQWGWPQIALIAVHDATGEKKYLDAALRYARGGMEVVSPSKALHWKAGVLADALAYTHAATGDSDVEKWLREYADAVLRLRKRDPRFYPAVAYVAAQQRDRRLAEAALASASRLELGSWGKPFTIAGRIGFRIHSLLSEFKPAPEAVNE